MTTQTQILPPTEPYLEPWPPHDTEESVLGTDFHQTTIRNLCLGINEAAHVSRDPGADLPWKALSQTALLGCRRPNGSLLRTYPDLFVYTHPIDPSRGSVSIDADGPPVLVLEVLSDSTYESDSDVDLGKGYSYRRAGVREYLTLDPTGEMIPDQGRGWRFGRTRDSIWKPEPDGRWHSEAIGIAIGFEGNIAAVYMRDGVRILREGEVHDTLAAEREIIAADREIIAADRETIAADKDRPVS